MHQGLASHHDRWTGCILAGNPVLGDRIETLEPKRVRIFRGPVAEGKDHSPAGAGIIIFDAVPTPSVRPLGYVIQISTLDQRAKVLLIELELPFGGGLLLG